MNHYNTTLNISKKKYIFAFYVDLSIEKIKFQSILNCDFKFGISSQKRHHSSTRSVASGTIFFCSLMFL